VPLILGKEPGAEFKEIARIFLTIFSRPSYKEGRGKQPPEEKTSAPKETPKKPQRKLKEVILVVLKKQPSISIRELAAQCELSVHSVQHHINKLKEDGVIRHVGPTKAGRWEVTDGHFGAPASRGDGGGHE
jgi:ATP-dependent DNA helicase RecG